MLKWSYSGYKQYLNCPRQFYETKVTKNFPIKVTPQMLYGTEVHRALEEYVRDGTPLVNNYQRFQPAIDALMEIPGDVYTEQRMALTDKYEPCTFGAKDYWVRGIVDLLITDGADGYIIDYKTGSDKYADSSQLKLMALMAFHHKPELQKINAGLLFIVHSNFIPAAYARDEIPQLWNYFVPGLTRMELSYTNNAWPENPSGLCKRHCPVTTCKFNGMN